jgi:XTP/dITP diphosphohydrolase
MCKVLEKMGENANRTACFRTVIALIQGDGAQFFEGKIDGTIATQPRGESGFGYDPIFVPQGYMVSFAQLSADEKNTISHRALAVKKLVEFLK